MYIKTLESKQKGETTQLTVTNLFSL